jgi:hypothetical protein
MSDPCLHCEMQVIGLLMSPLPITFVILDLGPQFGTPDLGPLIWDPNLGPQFGTLISDLRVLTAKSSCNLLFHCRLKPWNLDTLDGLSPVHAIVGGLWLTIFGSTIYCYCLGTVALCLKFCGSLPPLSAKIVSWMNNFFMDNVPSKLPQLFYFRMHMQCIMQFANAWLNIFCFL